MSHQELDEKPLRLSFKRSWEKIIESLELDNLEANETAEKTFDCDGMTMHSSIPRKDSDMHRSLLDETDKRYSVEREDIERALKEVRLEAQGLREQVIDLEHALSEETEKNKQYFKAVELLESNNERLEKDNMELKRICQKLNEKLYDAERQIEIRRQETLLSMFGRGRKNNNTSISDDGFDDKLTRRELKRMRTGTESPRGQEVSRLEELELKRENTDTFKSKRSYADDLFIKKFKFLKQKVACEQSRNRNLEFLISTQKGLLETANKNIYQLKAEKRLGETKHDKIKAELCTLNELRLKEKAKIDNVITFCDLICNCSFPEQELVDKLKKVPCIVSSFLKGDTDTMSFENKNWSSNKLVSSKQHTVLKQFDASSKQSGDTSSQSTARELEGIRSTLNNIAETLVQATPSADPSVLTNLDKISKIHLTLEECVSTESHGIMNPHFEYRGKENELFRRAVKKSHNMLWNLQGKGRVFTTESGSDGQASIGNMDQLENNEEMWMRN